MTPIDKSDYYRLLDLLDQSTGLLDGLVLIGPMEDLKGRPLLDETETRKRELRVRIANIEQAIKRLI